MTKAAPFVALGATAAIVGAAITIAPHLPSGPIVTPMGAFVGAVATSFGALFLASKSTPLGSRVAWSTLAGSIASLLFVAFAHPHHVAFGVLVDVALVGATFVVGSAIGARIEHAGHLLPAAIVAAAADLVSVLSPEGPSHAIASSERALSIIAFSFPAPGFADLSPAIGAGDLTMVALFLAASRRHELPVIRVALLAFGGALLSGFLSALTERAIPALPAIGAFVILGVPAMRAIRPRDRTVTTLSIAIAVSIAVAVIVRARMS